MNHVVPSLYCDSLPNSMDSHVPYINVLFPFSFGSSYSLHLNKNLLLIAHFFRMACTQKLGIVKHHSLYGIIIYIILLITQVHKVAYTSLKHRTSIVPAHPQQCCQLQCIIIGNVVPAYTCITYLRNVLMCCGEFKKMD